MKLLTSSSSPTIAAAWILCDGSAGLAPSTRRASSSVPSAWLPLRGTHAARMNSSSACALASGGTVSILHECRGHDALRAEPLAHAIHGACDRAVTIRLRQRVVALEQRELVRLG